MPLSTLHLSLSTLATQLPELPEGPSLENVRGPVEVNGGYEAWQIALAALAILLIAAGFLWLYLRARNKPSAPVDPQVAALAELDAATQADDDERFALLCANALRRYLQSCYHLPATSQTSAEIAAQLPLDPDLKSTCHNFLNDCDGVKFARRAFSEAERREILDTARDLIARLGRKEAPDSP
ncbi:MAG: hypothetical protein R6U56_04270 [Opitutales bacterium]